MTSHDSNILARLQDIVGPDRVLTDADSLEHYGRDWTRFHTPAPRAVVLPGSIEEVQEIVRLAASERLAIVPSGGRTGLSAGAVACKGELVLALDRLNQLERLQPGGPHRALRCRRGDRATAAVCRRAGPVLPGGLRLLGLQPDRRQYLHQRRRHQGDTPRHDPRLGGGAQAGHRHRRAAGPEPRPGQEQYRLRPAAAGDRRRGHPGRGGGGDHGAVLAPAKPGRAGAGRARYGRHHVGAVSLPGRHRTECLRVFLRAGAVQGCRAPGAAAPVRNRRAFLCAAGIRAAATRPPWNRP